MVDDKKNIPDAGKAGESTKPEKAEPVKADSPVHDQPAPAKAGAPVIEDASKVVTPPAAEQPALADKEVSKGKDAPAPSKGCHNQRKQPARREIFREERSWRKDGCGV